MMVRARWCYALLVVLAFLLTPLGAQRGGGGKNPTSQPATAWFRCPGLACPIANSPTLTDAIWGDLFDQPYLYADGAVLGTTGEFSLTPKPGGRSLTLDFSNGPPPCVGCRRDFQTITVDADNLLVFQNNTIDPATGEEARNGLRSIPVGQTWRSRLKVAFNTVNQQGENIAWGVRFNPRDYAPSDHIWATRTGLNSWVLFATEAERAMLVSPPPCCHQKGRTNEGLYVMPFRVAITVQ
jgi:hypothetical protein